MMNSQFWIMIQSVRDATLSILLAQCLVFPQPVTSIQCAKSTIPFSWKKRKLDKAGHKTELNQQQEVPKQ